jgi:hypothetical protein
LLVTETTVNHRYQPLSQECKELLLSLVSRGSTRELYWSTAPPLPSAPEETPKGKASSKTATAPTSTATATAADSTTIGTDKAPVIVLGRPDPNSGPTRQQWAELLNTPGREQRSGNTNGSATANGSSSWRVTPLLLSAVIGAQSIVLELLKAGASADGGVVLPPGAPGGTTAIGVNTTSSSDGRTPLMYALAHGADDTVKALGACLFACSSYKCTFNLCCICSMHD